MTDFIYLASQSPRRRQLLDQLDVRCELLLAGPDEDSEALEVVSPGESPTAYVQRVTQLKLDDAVARMKLRGLPAAPVLCADTTVTLAGRIYGKPDDQSDAEYMLGKLAGTTHRVLTAVAVQHGHTRLQALSVSRVTFDPMSKRQIRAYVETGEPMGKAGAYAVQGKAAIYIARISGSYTGIMGLPLRETAALLRLVGLNI